MNKFTFSLIGCFLVISSVFLKAQSDYDVHRKIAPELLKEDLATLKENLELVHSGLYAYTPKEEIDQFFKEVEISLNEPKTEIEFYRSILPILSLIKNGHTGVLPSLGFTKKLGAEWLLFPFDLYWDADQLYVYRNLSDNKSIPRASVIKKINGEDANTLFHQLSKNLTRDGYNTTALVDKASRGFKGLYAYLKGTPETFDLELVSPEGTSIKCTVKGKTNKALIALRKELYGPFPPSFWNSDIPALELKIDGDIATMTIRAFDKKFVKKEKKQKFKKFYKASFEKMIAADVQHLILDLRGNGGGDPMPTIELFAHLHPEPFTFYKEVHSQVKRIPNKKLYTDLDLFTRTFHPLIFKKKGKLYHPNWLARMLGLKGLKESKPNKPYYSNKLYVLTDSDSFSATGETTGIIKNYNRATFIGEEAGGNPYQNTSGITQTIELPNSKTRFIMPFWLWIMNVDFENTGRGVIPDHIVRPSIQDKIDGRDAVMEYTLDLIRK